MRKIIISLIIITATIWTYGQDLKVHQCRDFKYGYRDSKTGAIIIPCEYEFAEKFSGEMAIVKLNGKWGCIDKTGQVVIPITFEKRDQVISKAAEIEKAAAAEKLRIEMAEKERLEAIEREKREAEEKTKRELAEKERRELEEKAVFKSEVAVNIPTTNTVNNKTFAVIIANENYRREAKVEFAHNDGETFKEYCIKTLGIPPSNVHYTADATLNDIRAEIDWICDVANAYHNEANIIFYYAGHGIPDESRGTSYLLPYDGFGTNLQTAYKLEDLYQTLGKLPVKSITIFMDACFSGAQRSGEMLASARGVAVKVKHDKPIGSMVVFSAAQGDETAFPYREKGHGLFTYFLLKKLQETKGDVTLGELGDYVIKQVQQQSIVINRKPQTPTITTSTAMEPKWKEMRLK